MKADKYSFFEDVYEVVKHIPKGRVTSYGAIAHYLGTKKSARMVGWAMAQCPPNLPAQRVVNSKGLLTGAAAFAPERSMESLLNADGVTVENGKVKNFDAHFWDPNIEMDKLF